MAEIKLLPCPFCGGEAIKTAFSWGNISDEYSIKCTICGASTTVLKSEEVIKAWNTRKPIDDIVERLVEKSYDSMHLDMSTPMTETWQIIDLDDAIDIVRNAGKEGAD